LIQQHAKNLRFQLLQSFKYCKFFTK